MERLTEKRDGQNVIPLRQDGKQKWALCSAGMGDSSTRFLYGDYSDKLAAFEDLEEQGLLLKLPCEIGRKVYQIYQFCDDGAWEIDVHKIQLEDLELIGQTVFLTQVEAEEALKRMERENEG